MNKHIMIKAILRLDCGVGMSSANAYLVSKEDWDAHQSIDTLATHDPLGIYAWEAALEFASGYGIYPTSEQPPDYDENDADWQSDEYSEDIDGWFELYNPEEHDGLRIGGGDWDWKEI